MHSHSNHSKLTLISSMFIFGTIGIFRKYIPLSSAFLSLTRGIIGTVFLILIVVITKKKLSWKCIKSNLILLLCSGAFIGVNWILLFESYRYTSVATATLCYYMAPIFVILVSPVFLKEKLTIKKIICVAVALLGMVLVSGIIGEQFSGISELKGMFLGLGAAVLYATVIILNKKIVDIAPYDKTIIQLGAAAVVLLPYVLITENMSAISFTPLVIILVAVVGIVHTGIAYLLYLGSMKGVSGQTAALLSYIDPVVAVLLSVLFLKEPMNAFQIIGTILVLGATISSELSFKNNK